MVAICGQELGTKKELLTVAKKYPADHTLMIGDAPGDYAAAKANNALFFPINPGAEEKSWQRLFEEGVDRFFAGTFAAAIGLLVWIGLQARLILLSSEINVVRAKGLWPRSLTGRNLTDADHRAHEDLAAREALFEGELLDAKVARDD